MELKGIMTALVTPLKRDNSVDEGKLIDLIEFQLKNNVNSLLILGGTGEYTQLTFEERLNAVDIAVKAINGRVPLIAGVLEPGLGEAIKFGKACRDAGADALLVLTPFYVHPTQGGIIDFYKKFNEEVNMKFMVYNIPYRTSVNALPETMEALADEIPNLVGIKECSPSLAQNIELLHRVGDRISVMSGEEFLAPSMMLLGAKGAVMATSCLVPDVWVSIYNAASEKDADKVSQLIKKYFILFKLLFKEINPGPLKYAMKRIGIEAGELSIPLREPSDELKEELDNKLMELGRIM